MRRRIFSYLSFLFASVFVAENLFAQTDSVDVTFYYKSMGTAAVVFLPGEFNNWGTKQQWRYCAERAVAHEF